MVESRSTTPEPISLTAEAPRSERQIDTAEAGYRALLSSPGLTNSEAIDTYLLLISHLVELAQHEQGGKQALHKRAGVDLQWALPLARQEERYRAAAEMLRLSWLIQFQQNRLDGSAEYLLEALGALELAGAAEDEKASIYGNLSYTFVLSGEFERAIAYQRKNVVRSIQDGNVQKQSVDFYVIGDTYLKLGELEVAKRYFEQSLAPYEDQKSQEYYEALTKLATIKRRSGAVVSALNLHLDVLRFFDEQGSYREVPTEIEVAQDYLALGQLIAAREHAQNALSDERAFTEQQLDASLLLMRITQLENKPSDTEDWINRIDALLIGGHEATGSRFIHPLRQIQFAQQSIEFYAKTGSRDQVNAKGQLGLSVYQHIKGGLSTANSSHLAWTASAEPFISSYIAALYELDRTQILGVLESTYSDSLVVGGLSKPADVAETPATIINLESYLSAEKDVMDALSDYEADPGERSLAYLEEVRGRRDHSRDRYLLSEADTGIPSSVSPALPQTGQVNVSLEDLVLRYYISEEVSFVLVKDHQSELFFDLPGKSDVEHLVQSTRDAMRITGMNVEQDMLTDLARLIPVDLIKQNGYRRIVIVPDDVSHSIPFSAINIGAEGSGYQALGESTEIVRTFSVHSYYSSPVQSESTRTSELPRVVIFADPVFGEDHAASAGNAEFRSWEDSLKRLPHTAREAKSISSMYPPDSVTTYLGNEATTSALLSGATRTATVLHIATHGYFNPATPDIVGIATSSIDASGTAQRGFLSLTELLGQSFTSRLIVISGCETMLGRPFGGLGVRSLAQGFMAQGAGAALGTLWKVPDRATAEFMQAFYSALLAEEGNASRALLVARTRMMKSGKHQQPSFWAAFAITSSSHQVDSHIFD